METEMSELEPHEMARLHALFHNAPLMEPVSDLAARARGRARRRRAVQVGSATLAVAAVVGGFAVIQGNVGGNQAPGVPSASSSPTAHLSSSQLAQVVRVAQTEAWSSQPGSDGVIPPLPDPDVDPSSAKAWPTSVDSVVYLAMTHQEAEKYLDDSAAPDDRPVIVMQETGKFDTMTTGPALQDGSANIVKGTAITFVVDPETLDVLDFGNFPAGSPDFTALKGASVVFQR